jgi:hypothetical protein
MIVPAELASCKCGPNEATYAQLLPMSVPAESNAPTPSVERWNYVDVHVMDGQRVLRPTHVAFDRLIFTEPPNFSSQNIEIIVTSNGQSHSSRALVLPHEPSTTSIPIQLIKTEQKAPAKLIA